MRLGLEEVTEWNEWRDLVRCAGKTSELENPERELERGVQNTQRAAIEKLFIPIFAHTGLRVTKLHIQRYAVQEIKKGGDTHKNQNRQPHRVRPRGRIAGVRIERDLSLNYFAD